MSNAELLVEPSPFVSGLKPYTPSCPPSGIDLFLDANEAPSAPLGVSSKLIEAMASGVNRYPSCVTLEAGIAGNLGCSPASIVVTAGVDDALERAIRSVCSPGKRLIMSTPSFEMISRFATLAGAEADEIEWWQGNWPLEATLELAGPDTAAVAIVSPNNPTGSVIARETLEKLAAALPKTLILLDHTYVEFADEDLTQVALTFPNVLIFRSFSKARGCAGLRVGYAIGDPRVLEWMRTVGQPFAVSVPSLAATLSLIGGTPEVTPGYIQAVRSQRERLIELIDRLGGKPLKSQGNFVCARFSNALEVRSRIAALGIAVRAWPYRANLDGYLRITLPGDEDLYRRLEAGLETAIAPQAVLFDLDGVLADVSRSYRWAIIETARAWGVEVTVDRISEVKAAGNANNDWELTWRLLAQDGVNVPLQVVTDRFESLYQGTESQPGLRETEKPLLSPGQLSSLADRFLVAIVTGRPRKDAERFLNEHNLSSSVSTTVCMEDAPSKPDPAPVRLALERLGVEHAWMLGDTPDDLIAARAAGVLPVGVVPPGETSESTISTLSRAGAWRVLPETEAILEVLS
ncbi:MAG: TIGR01548 family HAD-type hydrolase [bacterium]|nr:TIGR01548 family HAD-type hydrolase [bacterium]